MIAALVLVASFQQPQAPLPALPPPAVVTHRIGVLRDWVRAVERHTPGEIDSAGLWLTQLTRDDVEHLWVDIRALITLIKNPKAGTFFIRPAEPNVRLIKVYTSRDDREALLKLATDIESGIGSNQFYKRAAVLHSDAVMFVQEEPVIAPVESSLIGPSRTIVQTDDGQQTGLHGGDVNWEFGRMLLDEVREPAKDDTVRAWYRATMSRKVAVAELDTPHFVRGRELFPDDAEIQFLLGALHEGFSDPRVQVARDTIVMPRGIILQVQPEREELGSANRYFSRALQIDPGHVEARIRHGRVLARLGRHKEAVEELRRALDVSRDELMTYYAQMFAGASEEALGRHDAAQVAYEQAAALYARAQAPTMALSHLLHRSGDRQAAHAGLRDVLRPADTRSGDDDPWWTYHTGAGRFTPERVAALYRSLSELPVKQ